MFKTVEVILSAKIKLYAKFFFKLETEEEEGGGGGEFSEGEFSPIKVFHVCSVERTFACVAN